MQDQFKAAVRAYADWVSLLSKASSAFSHATAAAASSYSADSAGAGTQERQAMAAARAVFESNFRNPDFLNNLSVAIQSYCLLAKQSGVGQLYQTISGMAAAYNNLMVEPLRDRLFRSPSHRIHSEKNFSLVHYDREDRDSPASGSPLLVVYAFINRHYILDLLPHVSIIGNLLRQGFDVYATDWGTPSPSDKDLTIGHYVNNYLDDAVDSIRQHAKVEKVSLLGYCWGGDLALMYASLHPEKVKSIATLATPGDFSLDNGLLSLWTKNVNADAVVEAFGNAPSLLMNSAFLLRSPIDVLHKYPHFFEKQRDLQSIMEFVATEMWLYDSPPVPGEVYRQFVKNCYRDNLLIQNKMEIGERQRIDLKKVAMPYLNIVASNDDLVAPESSRALNKTVGATDSSLIEFKSGHVGACISPTAHKELWPQVGQWFKDRH